MNKLLETIKRFWAWHVAYYIRQYNPKKLYRKWRQKRILKKHPIFFRQYFDEDIYTSCMPWGFECGPGWFSVINQLADEMEAYNKAHPDQLPVEACQLKEKFGCYDDHTEVLTENGWKLFQDITKEDKIATLKNGKFLEYNCPTEIFTYWYAGDMYYLKTRGVNLLVTLNHNLYVAKGSYYNGSNKDLGVRRIDRPFELTTYKKYYKKNKRFKKDAIWIGKYQDKFVLPELKHFRPLPRYNKNREYLKPSKVFDMDAWLTFLGWYIAEGHTSVNGQQISIAFNYTDSAEQEIVKKAIEGIGYIPKVSKGIFRICDIQLGLWLLNECGAGAINKRIPSFVKQLPPKQIKILLNSLYLGDGYKSKTSNTLYTISFTLCNDVQELILKVGNSSSFYIVPPKSHENIVGRFNCFCINWLQKSNDHNTQNKGLAKSSIETLVPYTGCVYCVTVPNHIIYVRRGGLPVWCGNSLTVYLDNPTEEAYKILQKYEFMAEETCEYCGSAKKVSKTTSGWIANLCAKCHKKQLKGKCNA